MAEPLTHRATLPLAGQVALVTGAGRPRGIGRAVAVALARHGAHVVVTDLARKRDDLVMKDGGIGDDLEELTRTAQLVEGEGAQGLAVPLDVTRRDEVGAVIQQALEHFGRIDIVCNNAGTPVGVGSFLDLTEQQWELSWQVNVHGTARVCSAVIPHMRRQGGGAIVNNASLLGLGARPGLAAYTATKFAVVGLTKAIAAEFGNDGIRCNAVCPGSIETLMGEQELLLMAEAWGVTTEEAHRRAASHIPLERWGTPEDVADAVAFLAGPAAAYLTGVALPVAGGRPPGL